jgi:lipopolysaccharide export system permease protein
MRVPRILSFYILREILIYAGLGLLVAGSILVTQNLLQRLDDLAAVGIRASDYAIIIGCVVAMLSGHALPIAFLFGIMVAVGRISADSEVTAMRALGVSFAQFMLPVLLLAVLASALTGVLLAEGDPLARRTLRAVFADIASRGGVIEPGNFNRLDRQEARLLFVEERDDENRLSGVLISDRTDPAQPFTVVAERGRFSFDAENATAHLELEEGDIHFEPETGELDAYRRISFGSFDYAFDMSAILGAGPSQILPLEMSTKRIREVLDHFELNEGRPPWEVRVKQKEPYEIQYHRRLALPLTPLLFALVGVPLGLRRAHGARSWGVLVSVGLVFVYYVLMSFGSFLADEGALPVSVAIWLPNVAFAIIAIPLLYRARRAEV